MEERTLRVLEFTKIRERMAAFALSELGAARGRALTPSSNYEEVSLWQQETEEALVVLTYLGYHPLVSFSDVTAYIRLSAIGSTLTPKALLELAASMRAARVARDALVNERENTPALTAQASALTPFRYLEEEIQAAILSEDEIADHASPELANIRRQVRVLHGRVREKLNSMINNAATQKFLQDPIITVRNDRFVIPVKLEHRASVPGLVHDQSASGATLFIEPMAVVEINNDIKQWISKEKQEIERILSEFTARIGPEQERLLRNLDILAHLDFCFSKAQLSREMRCVAPKLNREGRIQIRRGRHPLIDPALVVPIDLWLGRDFTTLVITGPNTGGKTVTLKTVGLFTLMAQAGLHVPAEFGSELAVFDRVFADIGDEQSIEQSLSTFSSHMTNIVAILSALTPNSLALFDELGAGTDPTEGAALAMSILDELLERRVRTMATTHYSELKAYALSHAGVENASVEFNVETLRPTYRLSIGIPGKSNAFEISRKLGLPETVIDRAGGWLSKEQIRFEDVIANAEYHRQIAERERELAEEARVEMNKMRDQAEAMQHDLEKQREQFVKKAREDARRVLLRAQQESEAIISELKRRRQEAPAQTREHEIADMRKRLETGLDDINAALSTRITHAGKPLTEVKPGEAVFVESLNAQASVLTLPDAKGELMVQAGIMKMKVHISQLTRPKEEVKKKPVRSTVSIAEQPVGLEMDLRGMSLMEAEEAVEKYLDAAILQSRGEVNLIHGKGTGTLRAGLHALLKRHPSVKEYRLGRYGEGEDGVTVVTLR